MGTSISSSSLQLALRWVFLIGLFFAFIFGGVEAYAGVYEYVDEDGVTHYTSTPPSSEYILFIDREKDSELRVPGEGQYDDLPDEDGVTHHTDTPSDPHYVIFIGGKGGIEVRYSRGKQFEYLIEEAAERYDVDPALVKAIIRAESDFDPWAVSTKGAMGLMQLLPETAESLSVINIFDPWENIHGGVRHLSELLGTFHNDLELSLAAYNAGKSAVLQFGSIPPYDETQRYVKKVLRFYRTYK
jgi:soluble lytic murein transglycosylase